MKLLRLFINIKTLKEDEIIDLSDNDFDYLIKVMRKRINDQILVFNGKNGEFEAKLIEISKKNCKIQILEQIKQQENSSNITLAFAPVKNVRIDFVSAKATEMGVNKFQPIITNHSIVDKINEKRFLANAKEASEQCERLDVPKIENITKLSSYLKIITQNLQNKLLILCDESGSAKKASEVLGKIDNKDDKEIIIFIGPEGGFSKSEFEIFSKIKNIYKISLGKRILRSDTAIISSLALVNEFLY